MNLGHISRLVRAPTLVATAVPLIVGGASAASGTGFNLASWADVLVVALLMQIGTNALNEYADYRNSVDTAPRPGIAGVIVSGEVSSREVLAFATVCYLFAFFLGLLLVLERGVLLLVLGIVAILAGVLYSEGPLPVSSTPFGELLVGLVMGPLEVASAALAASGRISTLALICSVPVALLVASILLANNLRDLETDRERGRRTLAILIGRRRGLFLLLGLSVGAFLWSIPAFLVSSAPVSVFAIWLAFPLSVLTYRDLAGGKKWPEAVPLVAKVHIAAGVLLAVSIFLWP